MTYSTSKPDSGDSPSLDVTQIKTNFSEFAGKFLLNHTALNNAFQGSHESVILQKQTEDPEVSNNFTDLYAKNATSNAGTQPQLFSKILKFLPTSTDNTNAPNTPIQMTYNTVNKVGPQYQSFLPGGYLVIFGVENVVASNTVTITLTTVPTSILIALANCNGSSFNASTKIISNSQFQIFSGTSGTDIAPTLPFSWLIVGKV